MSRPGVSAAGEDYERERRKARWHTAVEHALAAIGCGVPGARCLKCRTPRGDRGRPARHHRKCALRGAGTWRGLLRLVGVALQGRWRACSSVHLDSKVPPHVLGWTLARVLALTPGVAPDLALDRWCGTLGFPAEMPIDVAVSAIDAGKQYPWPETVCHRGSLFVVPVAPEMARHDCIRLPVTVPAVRGTYIDIEPHFFRAPDHGGEVQVYAERGTAEDDLLVVAEAAMALARVDAFPPHPRLREVARWQRARWTTARRNGVELPEERAEREREAWGSAWERPRGARRWAVGGPPP